VVLAARWEDLSAVRELERAAGAAFRDLDMAAVADDEPPTITELVTLQDDGRAWAIADDADRLVAHLLLDVVDGTPMLSRSPCTPTVLDRVSARGSWSPPLLGLSSRASPP
jgi:hypothetical protein